MKNLALITALAAALAVPFNASAEETGDAGPGTVFVEPDTTEIEDDGDYEIVTDLQMFLDRGYLQPDWKVHERFVTEIAEELIIPDYVRRTGHEPSITTAAVEIASAWITAGDYNDMLAVSRLPGDCNAEGCIHQLWRYDGVGWTKNFEFRSLAVAYREGELVAVGDEEAPTKMFTWDGLRFVSLNP